MTLDEAQSMTSACLTMTEVARLLGVDVRTVSRACAVGQLPTVQVGRRTLVPRLPMLAKLGVES